MLLARRVRHLVGRPALTFVTLMLALAGSAKPAVTTAPFYSAQSIVHAATQTAEALAPNAIATIYGTNLSFDTASAPNLRTGATLPDNLAGVSVVVQGLITNLFYVSPTQINFVIPYILLPGNVSVFVSRQSLAGPLVQIRLNSTAPGMFQWNGMVLGTHLDGSVISPSAPATAGEIVVVYAVGLGRVTPDTTTGRLASFAAVITAASQTQILLAGVPCPQSDVLYIGLAPGFAGLYQINLRIPADTPPNPEFRVQIGPEISPAGLPLAVR